ncbi:major facilitator superfamily domain-containing protein 12-like [Cylas formicarius]|uniref:major facilitator superfamily domain-containing protein 12-like n=1 Tax=Cylas formicarius TaxID=197179 RepID=UPI00295845F5|nr:major facilitator superfamily domain-containing protein 12-like [Cylas formicarius]XP_060535156.1 major facilitator superfamily domain-containing protein 12-like [Cylas formicarius]
MSNQIQDDYSEVYQRLPLKINLAYSMGHVLNDVCASMWFTYLLVFFHLVLEFDNWQAGCLLLVGQVADALATPFIGYHSDQGDNFYCCIYGRRKIWHLIGTVCVLLTFPFIFSPCIGCETSSTTARMVYYSMFIIIFQFGWAAVQIAHLSLIPELTPNQHDRTRLTASRNVLTVIANVLVYLVTWGVLHLSSENDTKIGPGDETKFQHIVWAVMAFGLVCSVLFHVFVKESWTTNGPRDVRGTIMRTSVRDLLTNVRVYHIAVIYMASRLFVNLTQVFITLYLHEALDMVASSLALVPLAMYIASFATSFIVEPINRCANRKTSFLLGSSLGLIACLWIRWGQGQEYTSYYIYAVGALLGASGSIITVSSLDITTDLIGDNTDSGAFIYGIMSFVDKLSNGVVVEVIQWLHDDQTNLWYYRDVLTDVCGGAIILGAFAVMVLRKRRDNVTKSREDLCVDGCSSIAAN